MYDFTLVRRHESETTSPTMCGGGISRRQLLRLCPTMLGSCGVLHGGVVYPPTMLAWCTSTRRVLPQPFPRYMDVPHSRGIFSESLGRLNRLVGHALRLPLLLGQGLWQPTMISMSTSTMSMCDSEYHYSEMSPDIMLAPWMY